MAGLTDEGKEAFATAMDGYEGVSPRSLSEAPDGSGDTMAGVGVVNPFVVPAAVLASAEAGNGGGFKKDAGWGDTAPVTIEPLPIIDAPEGNLNGQSLIDQGALNADGSVDGDTADTDSNPAS